MQFSEREVTLQVNSRPLRLIYLISSREDLITAVALYTHVWGGAANTILPIPENDAETKVFKLALEWINPDYIFFPREGIPSYVTQVLEESPCLQRPISAYEVQQHINGEPLILRGGRLSHIGLTLQRLYPNGLNNSNLRLVEPGGAFNSQLLMQDGIPTQSYQDYLVRGLTAKVLPSPETMEQLLKVSLLLARLSNPTSLTIIGTRKSWNDVHNPYIWQTNDEQTLCLFLEDGQDIGVATAFWNCRWLYRANKLFLPREGFLNDIDHHACLIVQFMPLIRALFVTTNFNREAALVLYSDLKKAFSAAGREILVKVCYRDFRFDWINAVVSSGGTNTFSRVINQDSSVRFDPPVPSGHENTDFAFGYDVEVKFITGRKLSMPATPAASMLLTNELWRIESAEKNEDDLEKLWLKQDFLVRTGANGITGTAHAGKECRFYVHPDDIVITRRLKDAGFEVRLNDHTRYAKGFVKRFGGFEKAISIIDKQAADIISALVHHEEKQGGLYRAGIISFLIKQRSLSQKEAGKAFQQKIELLLEKGLVRRGYSPRCPSCNLKEWYSLEEVGECIECRGCAENFLLPWHGQDFTYKLNELAARLVKEGGLAVLMTAALCYRIPTSGFIQFGGELLRPREKENFAEVDLFWLTGDALIICECKSYNDIDQKGLANIEQSLEKTVKAAILIDAQVVILGVETNSSNLSLLLNVVADGAQNAKALGIGVHLALNGKLHLWGSADGTEPWQVRLEKLQVYNNPPEQEEWCVGESPTQYRGFTSSMDSFNQDVLRSWEDEIGIERG